jgi:hypothetical protein
LIFLRTVQAASGGRVDRVAASWVVVGQRDDEVAFPAGGLVDGIVGAEDLSSAGHHGVAGGGVVDSGFLGIGVGAGADEVTLAHEGGDVLDGASIALDEGSVGFSRLGVGEDDASAQRGVAFEIDGSDGALVHKEDDLAASAGECGPVAGEHRLIKGLEMAAHVVWSESKVEAVKVSGTVRCRSPRGAPCFVSTRMKRGMWPG